MRSTKTAALAIAIAAMIPAAGLIPTAARAQGTQNPPPPTAPPVSAGESSSKRPIDPSVPPPPPDDPAPAAKDAGGLKDKTDKDQAPLPAFNPVAAQKDIEVGTYYMKTGDLDAAIDRFHDATIAYPTYAQPWLLMGEAYEKKGDPAEAVKSYEKYLRLYPHAPTRKKLEERIAQLQTKLQHEPQKTAGK
jgi:tetratricopeptide (TPR) repeat protein